jgi:hypothetical protein
VAEFLETIDQTLRAIAKREESITMGMEVNLVGQTLGAYRIIEQIGQDRGTIEIGWELRIPRR